MGNVLKITGLSFFVRIFAASAVLFAILAIVVLVVPPISDVTQYGSLSALSAALSSAFSLIIGFLAVVIVATTSRSDFRTSERVKEDLASLHAIMYSLLHRSYVGMTLDKPDMDNSYERENLSKIIYGPTGFALQLWVGKKSEMSGSKGEEWRTFFLLLAEIMSTKEINSLVVQRALYVNRRLAELSANDVSEMARMLDNLASALSKAEYYQDKSPLIKALVERNSEHEIDRDKFRKVLQNIHESEPYDPNVDLFIAVIDGDAENTKKTLRDGANPRITQGEIMRKYKKYFQI